MRNLRQDQHQPYSLVCDPMQRFAAHGSQMECGCRECFRCAPLLRRGPCAGLHQPMVRIGLFAAEAGLHEISIYEVLVELLNICVVLQDPTMKGTSV
jgi:hypothetical protein